MIEHKNKNRADISCKRCGERDAALFYPYKSNECKACHRKRVSKGSKRKKICTVCGTEDIDSFYIRRGTICKRCHLDKLAFAYKEDSSHRDKRKASSKNSMLKNIVKYRVKSAYKRAVNANMEFDLTVEKIEQLLELQSHKCAYSGISFDNQSPYYSWSIDRVDSAKGYTMDNVKIVCSIVNSMKNDLSMQQFKLIIQALFKNIT